MITRRKKFKKGEVRQTVFFSVFLSILVLAAIGFLVFSNLKVQKRRAELTSQIDQLKKEIQIIEEKNNQLRAGISQSEKESYWEEKIREQGYKKPGEEVTVILPPKGNSEEPKKEEKNFWQKLLEKIGF